MPKKSTVFTAFACVLSVAAIGVAATAYVQVWMNQPLEEVAPAAPVEIGDVAGVKAAEGDVTLDLAALDDGGNTQLIWHCGKFLMGTRHDYVGAWTHLQGRALIDPKAKALRAGELHVTVGAMRGHGEHPAPNGLINTVRANQWFLEAEHPTAVFRFDQVTPRGEGEQGGGEHVVADWTHTLRGTLELNGITQPLAIPARLEVGEASLRVDATFPVSRAAYEVSKRTGYEPPAEVDEDVVVEVHVNATPDPLAVIAELNRQIVAQQAATGQLTTQTAQLSTRIDRFETTIDELKRELTRLEAELSAVDSNGGGSGGGPDVSALPASFTDHVDYQNTASDPRLKDLGYQAEFEMVLVPGDPAKGIKPFYVQTTEVTWRMFRAWSYCEDIAEQTWAVELKDARLRPSPCYDDASRGHGFEGRAVLGVSRRNALAFCRHVSEQTGRPYRLWTDDEWHYVAEATGGLPSDPLELAWLADNADCDDFGDPRSMPAGKKPADSLGLHDFWGNVAEWVMADTQYIRGGSYLITADELKLDWREDESQDIWNMTYPNTPKSLWWYRDRFDMGFRLVCDPVNIPSEK